MPQENKPVNIFWFRRDLRLHDNQGLSRALAAGLPLLCLFIFDKKILEKLPDSDDARVNFIYQQVSLLKKDLRKRGSDLIVLHDNPEAAWTDLLSEYSINAVFSNTDYEPYAIKRDKRIAEVLHANEINFYQYKDQVIFQYDEVLKPDGTPYTIFTPYANKWKKILAGSTISTFEADFQNFYRGIVSDIPPLASLGFKASTVEIPDANFLPRISDYLATRDIPSSIGTSLLGIHLRFGTVSIRDIITTALTLKDDTFLNELIWREFFMMLLWHFPHTVHSPFRADYNDIQWINNEKQFTAWCEGKTGYPIIDAGMRQLKQSGWMHNRVRMITSSFLCKHLLVDWRWGEAHFARYLLDYEMSSNVGNWQWAASCGADAVPYFRIFNPTLQQKKFDPHALYIKKWVAEIDDPFIYPQPIIDHEYARKRAIDTYKKALSIRKH